MASALRSVRHEDQLSLVEHLDELRTRILVCLAVFITLFGVAFWQNDAILEVANRPFIEATSDQEATGTLAASRSFNQRVGALAADAKTFADAVAADEGVEPDDQGGRRRVRGLGRRPGATTCRPRSDSR